MLPMARQTDAGVGKSHRPGDVSPGLRVVDTEEPGSGRRRLLHNRGRGRGWLSSFLSPLLTIPVPGAGLCSRLEVRTSLLVLPGGPGDGVPETTGQVGQGRLLCPPASTASTLPERPQGPGLPHLPTPPLHFILFSLVSTQHTCVSKVSQRIAHHLCSSPQEKKSLLVTVQKKKKKL